MRQHVQIGCELLARDFAMPETVFDIIVKHHERIDGSGYPAQLTGEEIGLYPEMAGIVDSYCAMSYPRAFRPARNPQWVIDEINAKGGLLGKQLERAGEREKRCSQLVRGIGDELSA